MWVCVCVRFLWTRVATLKLKVAVSHLNDDLWHSGNGEDGREEEGEMKGGYEQGTVEGAVFV